VSSCIPSSLLSQIMQCGMCTALPLRLPLPLHQIRAPILTLPCSMRVWRDHPGPWTSGMYVERPHQRRIPAMRPPAPSPAPTVVGGNVVAHGGTTAAPTRGGRVADRPPTIPTPTDRPPAATGNLTAVASAAPGRRTSPGAGLASATAVAAVVGEAYVATGARAGLVGTRASPLTEMVLQYWGGVVFHGTHRHNDA